MEERIARICWNEYDWKKPSGPVGKSKDEKSFEVNPGFGHEEWIFDFDTLIDGYKYAFLDPVRTDNNIYKGKVFSIWLFALRNGQRYCIGKINKVVCLDFEQANKAVGIYEENKWLDKMKRDLEQIGISGNNLNQADPLLLFNVKFNPKDIVFFKPQVEINKDFIPSHRYILQNANDKFLAFMSDKLTFDEANEVVQDIEFIIVNGNLSESEKLTLVNARIGQGQFRKNVIDLWGNGEKCALKGIDIKEILVASHIKAWKDCETTSERLDGANGVLLSPNIDKLFDRYLITFIKKNRTFELKISPKISYEQKKLLQIQDGDSFNINNFDMSTKERFEIYMEYHNKKFFEK